MCPVRAWFWSANAMTCTRLFAGLLFASLAFQPVPRILPAILYVIAMISDIIDGQIARHGRAQSHFGRVLDLIGDKSLSIVSLLFAAECRIAITPLTLIGVREMIMLGARLITVDGQQALDTSRRFGGLMAAVVWGNTLLLFCERNHEAVRHAATLIYWACATIYSVNLLIRVWRGAKRFTALVGHETK